MPEIKPTGEGLAVREAGRPEYADIPYCALIEFAKGYGYWEGEDQSLTPRVCNVVDRLYEFLDCTNSERSLELLGQAMAGMALTLLGNRDEKVIGFQAVDAIHFDAVEAIAATFTEGAAKYGQDNWRNGLKVRGLMSHALRHAFQVASGDESENHLGHFLWNCAVAIYMLKNRPELDDRYRGKPAPTSGLAVPDVLLLSGEFFIDRSTTPYLNNLLTAPDLRGEVSLDLGHTWNPLPSQVTELGESLIGSRIRFFKKG